MAEQHLIQRILTAEFPPNTNLPAKWQLTLWLGINRPTLREISQWMEPDGQE
jgi:DNA-binding FadR family transcriptional regulator